MSLEINITDLKAREIIKVLVGYPYGHLEIKQSLIFWIADGQPLQLNDIPSAPPFYDDGRFPNPRKPSQLEQAGRTFKKMADTLGSMIGGNR